MASTHAYSTIKEYADEAAQKGLQAIAITDHAPGVADGAHPYHFSNLRIVPRKLSGVTILRGAECTIQNENGTIDLDAHILGRLDIVIASIHQSQFEPKNARMHTKVLMNIMENPYVHILGHIGREQTEFDIEAVVKKAKETGKLIEINASTLDFKKDAMKRRCFEVVTFCKKHSVPLVVSSDSHICRNVGNVDSALTLLDEAGFDEALVMNTSLEKITDFLKLSI